MKRWNVLFWLWLLAACLLPGSLSVVAQAESVPWAAWTALDVTAISDDHSGSSVAITNDVVAGDGDRVLSVTPSGAADETKLELPFTGAALAEWANAAALELTVYLPEANALPPNRFFLGLADVTGGAFTWVDGVFGEPQPADSGWTTVVFQLSPAMRAPVADHRYRVFLSFFNASDSGAKTPLTEPFYVGGMALAPALVTQDDTGNRYQQEVEQLLDMDDAAFVDAVTRETFDYFWQEANPANGLIKDRSTPDSVASIAAVGFGLAAIPIGVDRGWIPYDEAYDRVLTTLETFTDGGVQGERGFFYHFVNMRTGARVWESELSSIDTALLVAGALVSAQYFAGTEVEALANQLYENVEWDWMTNGGDFVRMGWRPESGFLSAAWDHFDESLILYVLAIGSPAHPVAAEAWDHWRRPVNVRGEYIYLPGEPLFVYQYPLAFLDLRNMEDAYASYWNNAALACARNRQFTLDNADDYATYDNGVWGLSASDGPRGYRAYGAAETNHDGTIAPYASAACLPFTPTLALEGMRAILSEYGARAWRDYGFVSAVNEAADWYSRDHLGIDQGDILLMLTNWQDGFVWDLFMAHPSVQAALDAMGFVTSTGDYAVTPAYMADVTGP